MLLMYRYKHITVASVLNQYFLLITNTNFIYFDNEHEAFYRTMDGEQRVSEPLSRDWITQPDSPRGDLWLGSFLMNWFDQVTICDFGNDITLPFNLKLTDAKLNMKRLSWKLS